MLVDASWRKAASAELTLASPWPWLPAMWDSSEAVEMKEPPVERLRVCWAISAREEREEVLEWMVEIEAIEGQRLGFVYTGKCVSCSAEQKQMTQLTACQPCFGVHIFIVRWHVFLPFIAISIRNAQSRHSASSALRPCQSFPR